MLSRWLIFFAFVVACFAPAISHAQPPAPENWLVPGRQYYFPVQPPALARYSRVHHDYPATDIFVPVGSMVVAVTSGVVDEVSRVDLWNPKTNEGAQRGGLWVTIVGDDGVRYHASHLSQVLPGISPGVRVTAGQRIGLSGKSGNARTTPAHVHFGISRPTHAGDWQTRRGQVNPFVYLNAWKRGNDLKPVLP
jgi:murein DD-endopeptidase MepM/ murein hydrolase activator NlpD